MNEEVIRTGVDDLLDLLEKNPKMALSDAATALKVDVGVVQAWVDFLVEEGIVGIEYRFTTPYIYLNKTVESKDQSADLKSEELSIGYFKKKFWEKAIKNNISGSQIEILWQNHVNQALELKKKYFMFEAQRRKLPKPELLWQEYKELVQYV